MERVQHEGNQLRDSPGYSRAASADAALSAAAWSDPAASSIAAAHLRMLSSKLAPTQTSTTQASSSASQSQAAAGRSAIAPEAASSPISGCPWLQARLNSSNAKLTRRQLRQLGKCWTLEDVKKHKYVDDAWIAVDGKVYDITEHILTHPGWHSAAISTVLSIVSHVGSECTEEFTDIHRPYPVAWRQLQAFYIGDLAEE